MSQCPVAPTTPRAVSLVVQDRAFNEEMAKTFLDDCTRAKEIER